MTAASHVLLVHGAWHGGWAWDVLRPHLHEPGWTTAVVDLPSAGGDGTLADDAATVRAALDAAPGPTVVVGHSYGGQVISEACAGRSDVAHLVYVCAFQLEVGESLLAAVGGSPPWWFEVDEAAGRYRVREPVTRFFADVDPAVAADAAARLTTQTVASFTAALTAAAWHDIPSTYLACTADRAIPVEAQRQMAQRAGTVHTLETSHSPFLAAPELVADLVAGAARRPSAVPGGPAREERADQEGQRQQPERDGHRRLDRTEVTAGRHRDGRTTALQREATEEHRAEDGDAE